MKAHRQRLGIEMLEDRWMPAAGFLAVGSDGGIATVRIYADRDSNDTYETLAATLFPFGGAKTDARVALGDFDGDGNDELVVARGPGGSSRVVVYSMNSDGSVGGILDSFLPFTADFQGGINLATGDLNNDMRDELVVATDSGKSVVKVFSDTNLDARLSDNQVDKLLPFGAFTGGVRLALANTNNVGGDEVVVARGPGGPPQVKVYTDSDMDRAVSDHAVVEAFLAYGAGFTGGIYVAAGPIENQGVGGAEIIVGPGAGRGPLVKIYSDKDNDGKAGNNGVFEQFNAYSPSFLGGVRVAAGDTDDSGSFVEVITVPGPGMVGRVKTFDDTFAVNDADNFVGNEAPTNSFTALAGTHGVFAGFGKVRTAVFARPGTGFPQAIPENDTLVSSFTVSATAGIIRDLDIDISLFHTFNGDLDVTLTHVPSGISVVLFTDISGTDEGMVIRLNDEAATDIGAADNPTDGAIAGTFNPEGSALLSVFDGIDASGEWRLTVTDDTAAGSDVGILFGWTLRVSL